MTILGNTASMPGTISPNDDLMAPTLATLVAVVLVPGYFFLTTASSFIDLLLPAYFVVITSVLWGFRRKLGFAILGSAAVLGAFGIAHYLRFPHSYVFTGKSYSGLGWGILGVELVMCFGACAFGFVLGRWWSRRPPHVPGICDGCGYDLQDNQSGRCSECGLKIVTPQSPA